jgi:glycosidase
MTPTHQHKETPHLECVRHTFHNELRVSCLWMHKFQRNVDDLDFAQSRFSGHWNLHASTRKLKEVCYFLHSAVSKLPHCYTTLHYTTQWDNLYYKTCYARDIRYLRLYKCWKYNLWRNHNQKLLVLFLGSLAYIIKLGSFLFSCWKKVNFQVFFMSNMRPYLFYLSISVV